MAQPLMVKAGAKIRLTDFDPDYDEGLTKEQALEETARHVAAIDELSYRLYAEGERAVLVVLQGMDAAGKDGTIRHVFTSVDPQSTQVVAFKQPSHEELAHDFLWRIHYRMPRRGNIGIFNRSHYEDVIVVRVHELVPKKIWEKRYDQINAFEKAAVQNGTTIVKCFLHISRDEQRKRLQARLDDPQKRWKFAIGDLDERKRWDDYQEAYNDALTLCNTEHAPWQIIPADQKWYRNLAISRLLAKTLKEMDPQFPEADPALERVKVE